jgi:Winged helix DNA-binding domain
MRSVPPRPAVVRRLRLRAQRLSGARPADPVEAVRSVVGVQAQDRNAAFLAVRARAPGVSAETVEHALSGDHTLVRTWAMRGTLHLLDAADLPLALAVFAPLHLKRGERRLTQLGLPPAEAERSTAGAAEILRDEGPLSRHELAERLRARGVPVEPKGQAPIHVVHRAALAGVLCEVGVRGREELYGPIDPGPLPDRDAAVAELARRYLAAHTPATAEDFASWSGLPAADVRRAWAEPSDAPGDPGEGGVRLLPAFDEWLLGWASRTLILDPAHGKRVAPGGGILRPVAIADGRVFATWRLDRAKRRVEIDPFGRVTKAVRAGIESEVAEIGAFLGLDLDL